MLPTEAILAAHKRNWYMVDSALSDLDYDLLTRRPQDHCNSVAWILWHMSRVLDTFINTRLMSREQVWDKNGWVAQFNIPDNLEDRGVGWTEQDVSSWEPPARHIQLGYYEEVKAVFNSSVQDLTDEDLSESRVILPVETPRLVADALGQVTWDAIAHGGQIAYLRGLFVGNGWHR